MTPIKSVEDAKAYALRATSRYQTEEEAQKTLNSYRSYLATADTEDQRSVWSKQIAQLEDWLASDEFRTGEYPQGLDDLILDLADWRSMIHAFQNVELHHELFISSHFFARWQSGAAYAIACILGKLTSRDQRDNSLVNIWERILPFLVEDHACTLEEAEAVTRKLHRTNGHFTNLNSKAILLRNKMIAHNESSPRIEWSDLDHDIEILARVWALIVGFCSLGLLFPFSRSDSAFSGLIGVVSQAELISLQKQRGAFLDTFKTWTRKNLVTSVLDPRSRAFAEISVTVDIHRTSSVLGSRTAALPHVSLVPNSDAK